MVLNVEEQRFRTEYTAWECRITDEGIEHPGTLFPMTLEDLKNPEVLNKKIFYTVHPKKFYYFYNPMFKKVSEEYILHELLLKAPAKAS